MPQQESLRPPAPDVSEKSSWSDVLQALQRLEQKLDTLTLAPTEAHADGAAVQEPDPPAHSTSSAQTPINYTSPSLQKALLAQLQKASEQLTVPHKVLLWPRIYADILETNAPMAADLPGTIREGISWFARTEAWKNPSTLPPELALPSTPINVVDLPPGSSPNVVFPTLPPQHMRQICAGYFDTFNLLYPILSREHFVSHVQEKVIAQGHADGDAASIILLLVYALGQVAADGANGDVVSTIDGHDSGFRGGSIEHPPGLAAFNEARRRFGFIALESTLETVQILLLQMIYVESHARHLGFWRAVTASFIAFQGLVKTHRIDWSSPYSHQVKCVFWTCTMNESFYHIDLDLPGTDILKWEDDVPLPDFSATPESAVDASFGSFLALIVLRAITSRIHDTMLAAEVSVLQGSTTGNGSTPPEFVVRELARQLDSWHATLPDPLRWSISEVAEVGLAGVQIPPSAYRRTSPARGQVDGSQQRAFDIATGQLHIRYYYARFMLYRAFVYKALHIPEEMTEDDADFCALAISAACKWPFSLHLARDTKRLFPHLFSWTQTCLGVLLIFRMTAQDHTLRAICEEKVSRHDIPRATGILLDWLRDVQQLDGIAGWCYETVSELLA